MLLKCSQKPRGVMAMFSMKYVSGHVHVFDFNGDFLFSAFHDSSILQCSTCILIMNKLQEAITKLEVPGLYPPEGRQGL